MRCERCQTELSPDAVFCDECGARLGAACRLERPQRPDAKFCRHCGARLATGAAPASPRFGAPQSYTPRHLAERILRARGALEGERKQVTVLFADVEDFSGFGGALDPEGLHELMDRVFAILLEVIHRYEGTVNQFTGDGVMALFGAPVAVEHHALRAVQAALEIQAAMREAADELRARWGRAPGLRIGLNTGRVVVGTIGDDLRMDYTAQGDTVNLAARLQTIAPAGEVAMSEATYRLVASRIECTALGPHRVKGRDTPVDVFRPERLVDESFGSPTLPGHRLPPLVGREAELTTLLALYAGARAGRARVAIVTGEAGVGKSRLLLEFRDRIAGSRPLWFEGRCVAYGRSTPYRPIVDVVRSMLGLDEGDPAELATQKLAAALDGLGADGRQLGPALRYVLALGPPDAEMLLRSPAERRAVITRALDRVIGRRAETPQVVVLADCQWLDSSSDEYLTGLSREMTDGATLLLLTYRPDEQGRAAPGLGGTHIALRPLLPSEAQTLVRRLAGATPLSDDVVAAVVDRAGGNALFIEEITRALLRRETVEVPATIADVLMARIDRLPPAAKALLQTASVIGREFSRRLLERVCDEGDGAGAELGLLRERGFVVEAPGNPDAWAFRQGLLQETAYEALLGQRRRLLHRRVGDALEDLDRDRLGEHVDALAQHFLRAEEWARAASYLREAGRQAAALSANREAVQRLTRALEAASRMPETLERTRQTIDIRLDLRPPLLQLGRLDDVLRVSREAEDLARVLGDERRLADVYTYLINYHYLKGEPDVAIEYGQRYDAIGGRAAAPGIERSARQYLAASYHALGRLPMAEDILRDNLAHFERGDAVARAGAENLLYVTSCGWLAWTLGEAGNFADAHAWAAKAVAAADAADNRYAQAIGRSLAGLVWLRQGWLDQAIPPLDSALAVCHAHHLSVWQPIPSSLLGLALTRVGKVDRGLSLLRDAVSQTERLGVNVYRSLWQTHLAEGLVAAGQAYQAIGVARSAVLRSVEAKEAGSHARALLVAGDAYRLSGASGFARAEEALQQALLEAEELRMRPLVTHCYAALGRLAAARGDRGKQIEYTTTVREQAAVLGLHVELVAVEA